MRRVIFGAHTGYAGMDGWDCAVYPDGTPDDEISEDAWQFGLNNAEMYGIYHSPEMCDVEDESDMDSDQYSDNIDGWFEDYDPEKHDGHAHSGSWEAEFLRLEGQFNK